MRVKISFLLPPRASFPINYNYLLTSLIYRIIYRSSHKFSSFLHNHGFEFKGKHFKLFSFSQLLFEKKIRENENLISLGSNIDWLVCSIKDEFVQHFIDGLFKKPEIILGKEILIPQKVETIALPQFNGSNRFTCLSPITMSTKVERDGKLHMHYLNIEEPAFKEKIKENLITKYCLIYGKEPGNPDFEMEFDRDYLKRGKNISRLIDFKGIKIRGYTVPFTLKGDQELIKVGYKCGFGDKNSLGFGMVKVRA